MESHIQNGRFRQEIDLDDEFGCVGLLRLGGVDHAIDPNTAALLGRAMMDAALLWHAQRAMAEMGTLRNLRVALSEMPTDSKTS